MNILSRVIGRAYPVRDLIETQAVHGRQGSDVRAEWTTPGHWAHDNYSRSHLPQLCILATGWKARLLALIFWPAAPWVPPPKMTIQARSHPTPES